MSRQKKKLPSSFVVRASLALLLFIIAVVPLRAQKKADLTRLIIVGDSFSAGFQNGSLLDSQQVHGYAKLVAQQAGTPLVLPLIAPPGMPNVIEMVSLVPFHIVRAPGISSGRDRRKCSRCDPYPVPHFG